jgi:two-component system chemotaxis response regulator CheB
MVPAPLRVDAIVVGGSAGSVEALATILPACAASSLVPVVVCVHLPPQRASLLPELFASKCLLPVREIEDKQPILPGIWFAPPDYHLLIERERSFALSADDPVNYSRPSIDVLFESAADVFGTSLVAVILTGASEDGARGAKAVRDAGGFVIVQDPRTAEASTMPEATMRAARPQLVASVGDIAAILGRICNRQSAR